MIDLCGSTKPQTSHRIYVVYSIIIIYSKVIRQYLERERGNISEVYRDRYQVSLNFISSCQFQLSFTINGEGDTFKTAFFSFARAISNHPFFPGTHRHTYYPRVRSGMEAYAGGGRRRVHLASVLPRPPSIHRPGRRQARNIQRGLHLTQR